MGFDIEDWLPGENAPAAKVATWRKRIALVACSTWVTVFCGIIPAMTIGLQPLGKVAYADTIDKAVAAKLEPMSKAIAEMQAQLESQNRISKAFLARVAAQQVRDLTREWCMETEEARTQRLADQIDAARQEYFNAMTPAREYPALSCSDLIRGKH